MREIASHEASRPLFVDALRALAASLFAYVASLLATEVFYRAVEVPSLWWSRRFA